MTPEQQRIAIAKACGWKIANPENDRADYRHWTPPNCVANPNHTYGDRPPNYLNDLNACHEMEKSLVRNDSEYSRGSWRSYLRYISIVTDEDHPIDATAPQRAEAFLRTLGLWTETPTQPQ